MSRVSYHEQKNCTDVTPYECKTCGGHFPFKDVVIKYTGYLTEQEDWDTHEALCCPYCHSVVICKEGQRY